MTSKFFTLTKNKLTEKAQKYLQGITLKITNQRSTWYEHKSEYLTTTGDTTLVFNMKCGRCGYTFNRYLSPCKYFISWGCRIQSFISEGCFECGYEHPMIVGIEYDGGG